MRNGSKQQRLNQGAGDIWRAGSFLKENNVPVIVSGVLSLPNKESDPYDSAYSVDARLHEAGVKF